MARIENHKYSIEEAFILTPGISQSSGLGLQSHKNHEKRGLTPFLPFLLWVRGAVSGIIPACRSVEPVIFLTHEHREHSPQS